MIKSGILIVSALLMSTAASNAHAFDGKREGFQIGLGVGAHTSNIEYTDTFAPSSLDTEKKLAVSFKIGYGFSNQISGFIGGKGGAVMINGEEGSLSIGGFGGTYYFSQSSPSLYITGLFGGASVSIAEEDEEYTDEGSGWLAGIGYEITDRLHLELSHGRAELTDPINDSNTSTLETSFITMQYLWY